MKRLISYIFPIYNEADNIDLLYETITKLIAASDKYRFELIFVNDGSEDVSLAKLEKLHAKDKRITVLNFSRNFGHQIAVTAGLDHAKGDAVIIMDSDMQDPPSVSFDLIKKWEEGFDVVYAQRKTRQDSAFKKITAFAFYYALERLADIKIPRNTGDFRLLDKKVVVALTQFRERNRFLRGLVSYVGFKQTAVQFDRHQRHAGETGYPLKKMIKFATDGILSFSWAPIKLITRVGFFIACLSFIGIVYAIFMKFAYPEKTIEGWTFIVISILFVGGIQLIMLGVLGGYIGRIYSESQHRPLYIISSILGSKSEET